MTLFHKIPPLPILLTSMSVHHKLEFIPVHIPFGSQTSSIWAKPMLVIHAYKRWRGLWYTSVEQVKTKGMHMFSSPFDHHPITSSTDVHPLNSFDQKVPHESYFFRRQDLNQRPDLPSKRQRALVQNRTSS
ncbi:hypothetical protein G6F57_004712 [Rhizopus arrhizus]|uniref:Uncharacterized protein n=1 Tax=Rhizopus oryzae TaxID=64495 RepID=A0A9P7BRB5_RHIOR|nr:hypothetical protein G6F23_003422 [Rhizopus arrhizus]KAG1422014.1 hypothetical protein G6F58_003485 [Rhizopus delemar]KAG0762382.1 hypothetical protein G6F24_006838 [Rhizopus arrhizus]KAG0794955.1 hypothetical protein G6F21_002474 [Rhizopus arrhizus]KAG0799456.1 hypothetical protein G6F22_003209 [Rhizopus arrhizus]